MLTHLAQSVNDFSIFKLKTLNDFSILVLKTLIVLHPKIKMINIFRVDGLKSR